MPPGTQVQRRAGAPLGQRRNACPQAEAFRARATRLGVPMQVQPEDLSHGQINRELGLPSAYTEAVDRWLDALLR